MKTKSLFLIFFLYSSIAFSNPPAIGLSEHGSDLKKASFVLRYKYEQKYHKDWQRSTYEERETFLKDWYNQKKKDDLKFKEETKAKLLEDKELQKTKLAEKKRLAQLQKDRLMEARDEHKAKKMSKRNIDLKAKDVKRELYQLQKQK